MKWSALAVIMLARLTPLTAQHAGIPGHLRDRGTAMRTSISGTYVRPGELLIAPFFQYFSNRDQEYNPSTFGYGGYCTISCRFYPDYRGRFRAAEAHLFLAYGITDWLTMEFEQGMIDATQEKSPADVSRMPARVSASGLGDREVQLNVRFLAENGRRPELSGFLGAIFPNRNGPFISTPGGKGVFKAGLGMTYGSRFGTVTARASAVHPVWDSRWFLSEWAVEHLRRLSGHARVHFGIEGIRNVTWTVTPGTFGDSLTVTTSYPTQLITEFQWHINDRLFVRINNGFGISSRAADWAPHLGLVLSLPIDPNGALKSQRLAR